MNRPILIITLGYIIGIIWGLYFNISIVFLYALIILSYYLMTKKRNVKRKFNMFSLKRYLRYVKLFLNLKIILIIILASFISNNIINYLNYKYEILYQDVKEINVEAIVISNKKEEDYYDKYEIKVLGKKYKNSNLYILTNKKIELEYGDKISIEGEFEQPQTQRNYKGFNYKDYLKTKKIYGTIKSKKINILEKNTNNIIMTTSNNVFLKIKENIEKTYNKTISSIILGIMLGYTEKIDQTIIDQFSESNISHVLAVSGMHISYIIIISKKLTQRIFGKKISYIVSSIILIIYMFITGFSTSIVRAGIMGIINCMAFIFYRKSNTLNNIGISALIILLNNPFSLTSTSFLLSYGGTIGILLFNNSIEKILKRFKIRSRKWKYIYIKIQRKCEPIIQILSVTISAQLVIAPIMIMKFNTIGISFLITNLLLSFIIGFIVMTSFIQIIVSFFSIEIGVIFADIISIPTYFLLFISKLGGKVPYGNFIVPTINIYHITIYYIFIFIGIYLFKIFNSKKLTTTQIRIRYLIHVIKYKIKPYINKIKILLLIFVFVLYIIYKIPKNFKMYFIDVGQGDCTLITTPLNQNILIDGGGSKNYNVGKNILIPYLLDRNITKIDYVIISHFDQDHVGGILEIIDEIKIENIIISVQQEITEQYKILMEKVKKYNIRIIKVKQGDSFKIEKNVVLDILFPKLEQIRDNPINNNSIVAKITYKDFAILFTGDIEKIAEEELIKKYNNNELDVDILKVAHHGSKTSTIMEILELITPKIALIGVGQNNKFGHPNQDVLQRLNQINCKIYRTDKYGEITMILNKNCIKLTTMVNNKIKEK